MVTILKASTTKHFKTVVTLADIIWREHYIPIIGLNQVDYMLEKFQSLRAVESQVNDGFEYYIIYFDAIPLGYICIRKEPEALFLSKLYILEAYRGKKIGKTAINFVEEKAKSYKFDKIRLTVNIHNEDTIKAYEKIGFKNIGPVVADIGNGFVMDDFEMIKTLK